jgi:hypothetical protein
VQHSIRYRIELLRDGIVARGCPPEEARAYATSFLATLRGLMIDLLATGDGERVDEAFETVLADVERRAAAWAPQ